ncbi:MAG: outer membrane beta-barrel protein [Myxococcales bacterium]
MLRRLTWTFAALLLALPRPALAEETPAPSATTPEAAPAEPATPAAQPTPEEMQKRIQQLERRLALLEAPEAKKDLLTLESVSETALAFFKKLEIGGIVSASYTYNFNQPENGLNTGRGYDVYANQFMFNKALLRLGKPVEYDAFEWGVGFSLKLLFGQDAAFTQTTPIGEFGDLFEATATLNIPVGNGLKFVVGKYATPIGYESPFLEEAANWSGGLAWTYLEPFVHTGFALKYAFSSEWEAELMLNNGWDLMQDNNGFKSGILHVTFTPRENTTFSLLGFAGPEQEDVNSNWRVGGNFYLEHRFVPEFKTALQLDYGGEQFDNADGKFWAQWFGASLWLVLQPGESYSLALRTDFIRDTHGVRTSDAPRLAPMPVNSGMNLLSTTLTFNFFPIAGFRVAPELRWDYSTFPDGAFDGKQSQLTLALGVAYLF